MRAVWMLELPGLRAAMAAAGAILPLTPVVDGKWHPCDPDPDVPSGHYWLSLVTPLVALYRPRGGEIVAWQPDDRRLPLVVRERLTSAAAVCPRERFQADGRPRAQEYPTLAPVRRGRRRRGEVKTWLQQVLTKGPIQAVRVFELAAENGISVGTLRRAADELCVHKIKDGFAGAGSWYWTGGQQGIRPLAPQTDGVTSA